MNYRHYTILFLIFCSIIWATSTTLAYCAEKMKLKCRYFIFN